VSTADNASERYTKIPKRTPLLDADAVAEALGVTPRHVRRLVAERRIPFVKVGRFVRFDPGALDVWLDAQRVEVVRRGQCCRHGRPIA
jgi:excisionase family DNA binding protein